MSLENVQPIHPEGQISGLPIKDDLEGTAPPAAIPDDGISIHVKGNTDTGLNPGNRPEVSTFVISVSPQIREGTTDRLIPTERIAGKDDERGQAGQRQATDPAVQTGTTLFIYDVEDDVEGRVTRKSQEPDARESHSKGELEVAPEEHHLTDSAELGDTEDVSFAAETGEDDRVIQRLEKDFGTEGSQIGPIDTTETWQDGRGKGTESAKLAGSKEQHDSVPVTFQEKEKLHPVKALVQGIKQGVTALEVKYLQHYPIGTAAIRSGARTFFKRVVPAAAMEGIIYSFGQLLGSGGSEVVDKVLSFTTEGIVAPVAAYSVYKMLEGAKRAFRLQPIKRYWKGRMMAREDRDIKTRERIGAELDEQAEKQSASLINEALSSPRRTIRVAALLIGDGPANIEVKSVLHERARKKRVESVDRNDWIAGEFGNARGVDFFLNTSTVAPRIPVLRLRRRGATAAAFVPSLSFGISNPSAMALDAARNPDDRAKGIKLIEGRQPSDSGPMNPSRVSAFADGSNPLASQEHHQNKRNSLYAGKTMLGVSATHIYDYVPTDAGDTFDGFMVPIMSENNGDGEAEPLCYFQAEAVIDGTGQGRDSQALKDGGPHIQTITEFLKDPTDVIQALYQGQHIGVGGGEDSGRISLETTIAIVKGERVRLAEMKRHLQAEMRKSPSQRASDRVQLVTEAENHLRNVRLHWYGATFDNRTQYDAQTIHRYKKTLTPHIRFGSREPRDSSIQIIPHRGHIEPQPEYIDPHKKYSHKIERNADNLPVIDGQELGVIISAVGKEKSVLFYNGQPLDEQADPVKGLYGLEIGQQVPGKRIYVVGTKADIPFREEDPNQWSWVNAIRRRVPQLMPEDFFVSTPWQRRWRNSLSRYIPLTTQMGILIQKDLP